MSKHQQILEYLENLPVGKRVSVRSISNHLNVSDGTAYRAIKEAENRGIVETKPRSGTVRIEKKSTVRIERLTYAEIARITDSEVLAGKSGLHREFSKFTIGAMTRDNVLHYLVKGGLLIVGDRENIQLLALEKQNAILVTGGLPVSENVLCLADELAIPVMVSHYDTFTVATIINHALSNLQIKRDLTTVEQFYQKKDDYGFLREGDTIGEFNDMIKQTRNVRFPVINDKNVVIGVVSMLDVLGKENATPIKSIMSRNLIVAKPQASLANISQKMIFEDLNMLPVVAEDLTLLGVITRRQVVENLPNLQHSHLHTYSEQLLASLHQEDDIYRFTVKPTMIDSSGNFSQGILTEFLKDISVRVLTKKYQKNIVMEQLMLYFVRAVQIDDCLEIRPRLITEKRRSSVIDFEILLDNQIVAKALVTTKIN